MTKVNSNHSSADSEQKENGNEDPIEAEMLAEVRVIKDRCLNEELVDLPGLFEHFKNPLYAWRALDACEELGIAYPRWVCDYLANCAKELKKIGRREAKYEPQQLIVKALGMYTERGKDNKFTEYEKREEQIEISRAKANGLEGFKVKDQIEYVSWIKRISFDAARKFLERERRSDESK
ncbi:hypothetical protein N9H39_07265 [Gammaproteobacteria bacterium]|nr:hypothetical protein [Gammaproteobacteria bacterium]